MKQPLINSLMSVAYGVALLAVAVVQPAAAVPVYNIVPLGLAGPEHTRNDGYQFSRGVSAYITLNEVGQVRGYSQRFNSGSADLGWSTWLYNGATTNDIGLTGSEHTRNDGYKRNFHINMNKAGQVAGGANRFNGGSADLGETAWFYNGTATIDIGLTGSEHTRNDGYKVIFAHQLIEAGQVSGRSQRFNGGSANLGWSAWLYNGATTIAIGLTGSEHTRNDGYKESRGGEFPEDLNEAGQVVGESNRYNGGNTDLGYSAWLYNGTTTIDIGLTGSEHTRNGGYKDSRSYQLNEAGQVSGISLRYSGNTDLGRSAWLYNGTTTIPIGLTGAEHTSTNGYKYSDIFALNEAGQISGGSKRFIGSTELGESAWLYNGSTTIDIGLTGSEHTRNDGFKSSDIYGMNEAGQVNGHSQRYNGGSTMLGRTAWLYNGTSTIDIGLTGSEHTRNDGFEFCHNLAPPNEAGQVGGYSYRYNGGSIELGKTAWLYNGVRTIAIGLTGSEHTRNDGLKDIGGHLLINEVGQVAMHAYRYNGGSMQLGQDAWLYDPVLDQTFALQLSTRSDGYAFSSVDYLGEDGLTLGTYTLFDALDNDLGNRAFYFTVADGLHDLGSLVNGGLAANGWDLLANAIRANGLGHILGHGKLTSQSGGQMAYLLNPVPTLPGDYDDNGTVDAGDYVVWRNGVGSTYTQSDYDVWRAHFGQTVASASTKASSSFAAVPEPTTWLLVNLAMTQLVHVTMRRKHRKPRTILNRS
jgi:hypothetical protein